MKTRISLIVLIFSFATVFAQKKDGIKLQKSDESCFIEVDKVPQLIVPPKPVYPQDAKLQNIQGKVYLKILVDEEGNVAKIKIEKGANSLLDKSAMTAAKKAKFSPAMAKNKPVIVWIVLPITFKLDLEKEKVSYKTKVERELSADKLIPIKKLPEMISSAIPIYPEKAREEKIEGKVFVKVLVDTTGTPNYAVVIKSNAEILNRSSIDATMNSKFSQVLNCQGKKIFFWIIIPYKYTLNNNR